MVYEVHVTQGNKTLAGYNEWSLSKFDVSDFQERSVPDDPAYEEFGNVTECRLVDGVGVR